MHIVVCANSTWTIWNFRRALIAALIGDGHRITILAPADETADQLAHMGCRITDLRMSADSLNPAGALAGIWNIRKILQKEQIDAVLSYTIKSNVYCALAASSLNIPSLPNITGLGTAFISGRAMRWVAERICHHSFKKSPYVFFQNKDDSELFIKRKIVTNDQVVQLPGSGIDLDLYQKTPMPSEYPRTRILMISRIIRQKGVMEFVDAARLVRRIRPDVEFQILGDLAAQNRSAIGKPMLDGWIKEGTIEYLGTSADVRMQIARADCVVLPSYREGAPRALIEAAAMARPVITTDVPGCRSVVDDEVSGFLCAAKSAESLKDAILRFLALSSDARTEMGLAGRKKMEREFDQRRVIDAYRRALAELPRRIAYLT